MRETVIVGIGGLIGSVLRYQAGGWILRHSEGWRFPLHTFMINITGCLLIGVIAGFAEKYSITSPEAKLFLLTGLLGGYTTFSAFGFETLTLIRNAELPIAISYAILSVVGGLLAVRLGLRIVAA